MVVKLVLIIIVVELLDLVELSLLVLLLNLLVLRSVDLIMQGFVVLNLIDHFLMLAVVGKLD